MDLLLKCLISNFILDVCSSHIGWESLEILFRTNSIWSVGILSMYRESSFNFSLIENVSVSYFFASSAVWKLWEVFYCCCWNLLKNFWKGKREFSFKLGIISVTFSLLIIWFKWWTMSWSKFMVLSTFMLTLTGMGVTWKFRWLKKKFVFFTNNWTCIGLR